jgi:hypothetical protein
MAIPRFSIFKEDYPFSYKFPEKKAFVNIFLSYERELGVRLPGNNFFEALDKNMII